MSTMPPEAIQEAQINCKLSYRQLVAVTWLLQIKTRFSGNAIRALNHQPPFSGYLSVF